MMLLRMEMRGSGLDTESRSPTPQDREDTKDEVYWWLHFHKLQEYHSYFRGKSNGDSDVGDIVMLVTL